MAILYTQSFMQATSTAALADLGMVGGFDNTGRMAGRRTGAYSWSLGNTTTSTPRTLSYWLDPALQGSGTARVGKYTLGFAVGLDRSKDLQNIAFLRTGVSGDSGNDPGVTLVPMLGYSLASGVFYSNGGAGVLSVPVTGFAWYYIEMQVDTSSNSYELRIDGVTVRSGTYGSSGPGVKGFSFLNPNYADGYSWQVADLYFLDGTGTTNNDFLGDTRIETLTVSTAGTIAEQASGTASSVQTPDDATTTMLFNQTTQRATFNMTAPANTTGTIASVVVKASAKKTSGTARGVKGLVKLGGTVYESSTTKDPSLTTAYNEVDLPFDLNPSTGLAWTTAQVSGLEAGIKLAT